MKRNRPFNPNTNPVHAKDLPGLLGLMWDNMDAMDRAALVTSPVPVVGDIGGLLNDARHYANNPEERTAGNYALSALGVLPFVPPVFAMTKSAKKYPTADYDDWWGNRTYKNEGAEMVNMTPDEYLTQTRYMDYDDELTKENVQDLIDHVNSGGNLDPLALYPNGLEDGRHRALMAKELGIDEVPVLNYRGANDLPMDEASRMQRAKEAGKDVNEVFYHGTDEDITEFLPSERGSSTGARSAKKAFWFSNDPEFTARSYAEHKATTNKVHGLLEEANAAERKGDWDLYDAKIREAEELEQLFMTDPQSRLRGQNIIPTYLPNEDNLFVVDMKGRSFNDFGMSDEVDEALQEAMYQKLAGVKFKNLDDAIGHWNKPSDHVAIFNPKDIRSIFAKFDPAKKDSANILAGGLLGALGLSGAYGLLGDEWKNTNSGLLGL